MIAYKFGILKKRINVDAVIAIIECVKLLTPMRSSLIRNICKRTIKYPWPDEHSLINSRRASDGFAVERKLIDSSAVRDWRLNILRIQEPKAKITRGW